MPTTTLPDLDRVPTQDLITRWLTDTPVDGWESPAGPLFTGGDYALQEITMTLGCPGSNCSSCTGSRPIQCC
ncbi:DUF6229 family protein [Polymorphospora rubra]|uniref:Uncharacterized protein n=1 Tax=Polymorphospora rubra TaxID=338584 RepID=A0A810N764_9ACTN|nr:DUF6229 family protein [Polymorphospora rubra]BCJ69631.1 hypothetical protein Prubr_66520 [Polymorphospora rubra]